MRGVLGTYPPPRHNVLLLSCMDLRLIDELAAFMDRDNLTNRYDHLVFAGAALGVLQSDLSSWREVFFDHLRVALELHDPRDVYVVEHRNCGAYRKFLGKEYGDDEKSQEQERKDHKEQADALAKVITDWCKKESEQTKNKVELKVTSFLMDLRGGISLLSDPHPKPVGKKVSAKWKAGR